MHFLDQESSKTRFHLFIVLPQGSVDGLHLCCLHCPTFFSTQAVECRTAATCSITASLIFTHFGFGFLLLCCEFAFLPLSCVCFLFFLPWVGTSSLFYYLNLGDVTFSVLLALRSLQFQLQLVFDLFYLCCFLFNISLLLGLSFFFFFFYFLMALFLPFFLCSLIFYSVFIFFSPYPLWQYALCPMSHVKIDEQHSKLNDREAGLVKNRQYFIDPKLANYTVTTQLLKNISKNRIKL